MSSSASRSPLEVALRPDKPPMVQVESAGDPSGWVADRRDALRRAVTDHGSVTIRGLGLSNASDVGAVVNRVVARSMTEKEAFASRKAYGEGVYSSSAWPPNQQMCMHHELSYRLAFPSLMIFACVVAPSDGGAIALADSAAVLDSLPADLVERFDEEGWILTRNYTDEIGLSIAEAFGTDDRHEVESYCRANEIELEWRPDGGLRTWQRRRAIVNHPVTGHRCWFNQIAFLNEWTLNPEVHEFLVDMYGADGLPFNTRFGNGDPIGEEVVELVNQVYEAHAAREPLQGGDLLVVDNVRTAHSRDPFDGPREVLVALGDEMRLDELSFAGAGADR